MSLAPSLSAVQRCSVTTKQVNCKSSSFYCLNLNKSSDSRCESFKNIHKNISFRVGHFHTDRKNFLSWLWRLCLLLFLFPTCRQREASDHFIRLFVSPSGLTNSSVSSFRHKNRLWSVGLHGQIIRCLRREKAAEGRGVSSLDVLEIMFLNDGGDDLAFSASAHLLKPSRLSQRRKTHQEIIQLPPLSAPPFFLLSRFSIIIKKAGFHSSRIPSSSSAAAVCFWHQRSLRGRHGWMRVDVKHVCFLLLCPVNQAEGEESIQRRHLFCETRQRNIYSSSSFFCLSLLPPWAVNNQRNTTKTINASS